MVSCAAAIGGVCSLGQSVSLLQATLTLLNGVAMPALGLGCVNLSRCVSVPHSAVHAHSRSPQASCVHVPPRSPSHSLALYHAHIRMHLHSCATRHSPLLPVAPYVRTWLAGPGEVGEAVYQALKAGYRAIDCAAAYGNEKEVGDGVTRRSDVDGVAEVAL
jgi:hypothetical protein